MFTLICYVTNPVVILFSNEHGELPYPLRWWQTYDNCIDIPHTINSGVPKLFRYDFDKHYKYTPEFKNKYAMKPGYVEILDPNFTIWEKIQRYFCRNVWLYRNTAYGFSYEVCGRYVFADKVKTYVDYNYAENDKCYIAVVNDNRIFLNKTWSVEILDPNFTVWEKIQRYICRNVWLYRNTAYGFSYEVCGRYVLADKVKTYVDYNYAENDKCYIAVVNDNRIFLNKTWSIFYTKKYCKWFYLRIYLGWKFKGTAGQSMIAFHINPFRLKD
jgi:hypothetical protein